MYSLGTIQKGSKTFTIFYVLIPEEILFYITIVRSRIAKSLLYFLHSLKKHIEKVKVLVIDSTFKSSAQGVYQIVIIYKFIFGKTYPLMDILLSDKTESSYIRSIKNCSRIFNLKP
jgi:hypothetical protein